MKLPHPIPYQGSKRSLAEQILKFFPEKFDQLIEPFAGSAAITIASAYHLKDKNFVINDVNEPLIELWYTIINHPRSIIKAYSEIWQGQHGDEENYYYKIRDCFNQTKQPQHLLFLLAKCVKAAVRYNAQGHFNQSPDKRRLGRNPQLMQTDILRVSQLLKDKTQCYASDYQNILQVADTNTLIYMDPPYQGTGLNGGFNYAGNIENSSFLTALFKLNERNIPYILSYDGRTGNKVHGTALPDSLNLIKIEINAGRSSQATLLRRNETTFESVYLSPALTANVDFNKIANRSMYQTDLFF